MCDLFLCVFFSGCMPGVDYAVLDEWYQWITKNIDVGVDLIGKNIITL